MVTQLARPQGFLELRPNKSASASRRDPAHLSGRSAGPAPLRTVAPPLWRTVAPPPGALWPRPWEKLGRGARPSVVISRRRPNSEQGQMAPLNDVTVIDSVRRRRLLPGC